MIPHLIHQTAKTAELPKKWARCQASVKAHHPNWKYKLWTDAENVEFVRKEFPDLLEIYQALPLNILRVDVIRYMLLYRLGGLYADLDFEFLRPFEFTEYETVLPWEEDNVRVANAMMAAEPGSAYFKAVLDDLRANPPIGERWEALTRVPYKPGVPVVGYDIMLATGPHFLTRILNEGQFDRSTVFCVPSKVFCPPLPQSEQDYLALQKAGVAHGIHYCTGSWIDMSATRHFLRRVTTYGIRLRARLFGR